MPLFSVTTSPALLWHTTRIWVQREVLDSQKFSRSFLKWKEAALFYFKWVAGKDAYQLPQQCHQSILLPPSLYKGNICPQASVMCLVLPRRLGAPHQTTPVGPSSSAALCSEQPHSLLFSSPRVPFISIWLHLSNPRYLPVLAFSAHQHFIIPSRALSLTFCRLKLLQKRYF